jgi:hypothetical protein
VCIQSGYKTLTPIEIANCFSALAAGNISYRGVRVYFGCLAIAAIREAAARTGARRDKRAERCRYRVSELAKLSGISERGVKRELRVLERASILKFTEKEIAAGKEALPGSEALCQALAGKRSPKRPIPVPRSVLRFVAGCSKGALGKTMLAYAARGLSIERSGGAVKGAGSVKASWIAHVFGLSLRSVKAARKELIRSGFITKDSGSFQRKLNRDGAYFKVNLAWTGEKAGVLKISPLAAKTGTSFAPPYKEKKTSNESKNQKAQSSALKLPGVCNANTQGGPRLTDIRASDLKRLSRLKPLFLQAVKAGCLRGSEADFLNFVGAAVRSNSVGARDPVRVFVSIVKEGRWEVISQKQEDRAREAIRRDRENGNSGPKMFHGSEKTTMGVAITLSRLKL